MSEYHVGCGTFGIYAGILMPKKQDPMEKQERGHTRGTLRSRTILVV